MTRRNKFGFNAERTNLVTGDMLKWSHEHGLNITNTEINC